MAVLDIMTVKKTTVEPEIKPRLTPAEILDRDKNLKEIRAALKKYRDSGTKDDPDFIKALEQQELDEMNRGYTKEEIAKRNEIAKSQTEKRLADDLIETRANQAEFNRIKTMKKQ